MRLIDADALKEEVNKKKVVGRFNTLSLIDNAPTVEVNSIIDGLNNQIDDLSDELAWYVNERNRLLGDRRPHGKWIKIFSNPFTNGYVCSICGHRIQVTEQFLPKVIECESCGADMRGTE